MFPSPIRGLFFIIVCMRSKQAYEMFPSPIRGLFFILRTFLMFV